MFKITKGSGNNHTPLKPPKDSSPTYDEMEDISFRVSKLEDMIKGNVKIDNFVKLENNMDTKEDLKGMASKKYLKRMEKIEKQLESRNLESSKVDDSLQHHGFNLGPRNHFIPKIDMRKFDGKDPITWIFHMEQFFDLH